MSKEKKVVNALNDTLAPYIFDQSQENPRLCPSCNKGELTLLSFKTGSFVGCTSYDCKFKEICLRKQIALMGRGS